MRILRAALAFVALTCSHGAEAAGWLCLAEHTNGFVYDKLTKEWRRANFKAVERYVVRANRTNGLTWEVAELGSASNDAIADCGAQPNEAGILFCKGLAHEFRINTKNMRFVQVYWIGYWTYDPENWALKDEEGDTPSMAIGTCSAI